MYNSGNGKDSFLLNQTSGEVRTHFTFDFEKVNAFNFIAMAWMQATTRPQSQFKSL